MKNQSPLGEYLDFRPLLSADFMIILLCAVEIRSLRRLLSLLQFRREVIAVIDLAKCFGYPSARRTGQVQGKYIIAELKNNKAAAFHVHEALRINPFNRTKMNQTLEAVQGQRGFSQRIVQIEGSCLFFWTLKK